MPTPPVPRMSHGIPDRLRAAFRRASETPDVEAALGARALATFRYHRGPELLRAFLQANPLQAEGSPEAHAHPAFEAFHDAWVEAQVLGPMLEAIRAACPRVDHVILVPSGDLWRVVEEAALGRVLPPGRTIRLYYGPPGRMDPSAAYPTFDLGQCLPLAVRLLEALAPSSLYIRGSAQFRSTVFGAALKARFPGLPTAFEVYDYALMLDDELTDSWGFAPEGVADSRDAEAFLATRADFLLDKAPGLEWEALAAELLPIPRAAYAPTLGVEAPAPRPILPREPGPLRLLCAGSMPYFKNYRPGEGFPEWAYPDIIGPLHVLAGMADCQVDVFNASHPPEADLWEAFRGYATLFDPDRVAYHPRLPLPELLARMPRYDFGLFLFSPSTVLVDYPLQQSLPNRCMSCIAGGLPLIVNTEMHCLAALVERFQAGITLPCTEVGTLPERLRAADLPALREGVQALHRHLVIQNRRALEALGAALRS